MIDIFTSGVPNQIPTIRAFELCKRKGLTGKAMDLYRVGVDFQVLV